LISDSENIFNGGSRSQLFVPLLIFCSHTTEPAFAETGLAIHSISREKFCFQFFTSTVFCCFFAVDAATISARFIAHVR
jgi:hypothetical protein